MHTDSRSTLFLPIAYFTTTGEETEQFAEGHTGEREKRIPTAYI